jgi:hypothetical protein
LTEWTTPDCRNTPSTTNLEEEEIVNATGNDGNASMPVQVKRLNPWRKMMMKMGVNNQQDATTFSFIIFFNSALHVSGDKFAHPQEHFLSIYTAFGTMH